MPILWLILFLPAPAGAGVHDEVLAAIQTCTARAVTLEERRFCQIKATPRKCRPYLRGPLNEAMSLPKRQVWLRCIGSCEGATLLSRTLGECSTPSDPNK